MWTAGYPEMSGLIGGNRDCQLLICYKVPVGFAPNGFAAIDEHCLGLLFPQELKTPESGRFYSTNNLFSPANKLQGEKGKGTHRWSKSEETQPPNAYW